MNECQNNYAEIKEARQKNVHYIITEIYNSRICELKQRLMYRALVIGCRKDREREMIKVHEEILGDDG